MTTFLDFFYAVLPWVSIGIIVAILAVGAVRKPSGQRTNASKPTYLYVASVVAYLTSLLLWVGTDTGSHSHAIVWLSIGAMFLCIGSAVKQKRK